MKNKKYEELLYHIIGDSDTDIIMRSRLQKVLYDRK